LNKLEVSSIKTASRVVMVQEGKIIEDGTYENLVRPGTKFRELMDSQLV
jgi:ABC-type multidrug transport system fused ATPase/permease subunit